jgi:hypothetical protein
MGKVEMRLNCAMMNVAMAVVVTSRKSHRSVLGVLLPNHHKIQTMYALEVAARLMIGPSRKAAPRL